MKYKLSSEELEKITEMRKSLGTWELLFGKQSLAHFGSADEAYIYFKSIRPHQQ